MQKPVILLQKLESSLSLIIFHKINFRMKMMDRSSEADFETVNEWIDGASVIRQSPLSALKDSKRFSNKIFH